jgi:hypothetical protein
MVIGLNVCNRYVLRGLKLNISNKLKLFVNYSFCVLCGNKAWC